MPENLMDKIVSLCKRRGFIFQSSEIYGGLGSTWDYGPLGVELKNNVKRIWWKSVVHDRDDMVGLDAAILMHPKVWEASGHIKGFNDPLVDCKKCKKRYRVDQLVKAHKPNFKRCPSCDELIDVEENPPRNFNLMLKTFLGPIENDDAVVYVRPETAQGTFVNFANVLETSRKKLPFGIAQIGKAFRNEITPGNFTFRTREFEQMEIEYFVKPEDDDKMLKFWVGERFNWYLNYGMRKDKLRIREQGKDELAHYAKACFDIEYNFPFGWSELEGIANRTDFDLVQHSKSGNKDLSYFDDQVGKRYYPYIIEPSGGIDRAALAFLVDAYNEEIVKDRPRVFLKLHKDLAPTKVAVLPLLKNRPEIVELAKKLTKDLKKCFVTVYDDTAAIGKLYRRQDEVGTLFCVTIDVDSLKDKKVTVRHRDSMKQDRVSIDQLKDYLFKQLY